MSSRPDRSCRAGFTLVEMLVAMAIMLTIMLMMATIFHQSNIAWTTGLREVDMSMQGRAALNMIGEELSHAVADGQLQCQFAGNGLTFWTQGRPTSTTRAYHLVRYVRSGASVVRTEWQNNAGQPYPNFSGGGTPAPVVDQVVDFRVSLPTGASYTTNLPPWVELTLQLEKGSENAAIKVASAGRDKMFDTDDDVKSWKEDDEL
jgi:prepilin-type N-terminal cleavage/methylation domain-containing protein